MDNHHIPSFPTFSTSTFVTVPHGILVPPSSKAFGRSCSGHRDPHLGVYDTAEPVISKMFTELIGFV